MAEERPDREDGSAADGRDRRNADRARSATHGFYVYGVVRGRNFRGRNPFADLQDVQRVRYRDLEALVRAVPFTMPGGEDGDVQAHQRTVDLVMRRTTILPAPFGLVFRGRRSLLRFFEDQYLLLDEALAFVEGHWEVRVHLEPTAPGPPDHSLADVATHVYTELRRFARAAVPFPREERRLLTAAFLVERSTWIEFVERTDDLATAHPELAFDVTGPWPPYDFVRMSF